MNLDIKKVLRASLIFVAVGIILVIISMILELLSLIVTDSNGEIVDFISMAYSFLMIPAFLAMYFVAGMRAVKKHGLDAVGAGLVASLSYVLTSIVHLLFRTLLNILVVSGLIPAGAGFGSAGAVLAAQVFGDMIGALGLSLSLFCGIGVILIGAMINFVIGGFGGLFAQR